MTERQKFDLIKKIPNTKVEIRRYHSCVMADVIVEAPYEQAGSLGFRPLVTYISQNNIAMTAQFFKNLVILALGPSRLLCRRR